ncbi:MAG: TetR/AcrR family transcriptional regulator [Mycobacterium sp.]
MSNSVAARPGGRNAAVREAALLATSALLIETGFDTLELAAVAERAGVGKSTIYRRWGSLPALVADLLHEMAEQSVSRADTGSLRGDLHANAELVRHTLSDVRQGRLFKAIIAAATCDQRTADALAGFYDRRVSEWSPCVLDSIERGEAPAGTDAAAVIRQVSAPLYYQFLTSTKRLTSIDSARAADAAIAAVAAGVFVRPKAT